MSNITALQGGCLAPFLDASKFPGTGGFIKGRFCSDRLGPTCCLPCPISEFVYPDHFESMATGISWINVPGIACSVFLTLSFAFLPVGRTQRHYLSVCLAIGLGLMQLGFIIPLAAKPQQCYNEITPNDMNSSKTCALSGAFLIAGGWCGVMWIFLRSLALHLQICWQVVIGKIFMWGAFAAGWGIPSLGVAMALIFSGVSFRFGDTCHINHANSLADLWIPILIVAGLTVVTQFATFGYCIKVYLASLSDNSTTTNSSGTAAYTNSVRGTITPRQAYRRIRRVIELQWRGITIVLIILVDVIFFAVVFVFMDDLEVNALKRDSTSTPWLFCLIQNKGDKNKCLKLAQPLRVNEATVMSVLILLSLNGIWCMLLLGRLSMFKGWYELVMGKVKKETEFVSVDVNMYKDATTYEMLGRDRDSKGGKTPEPFSASTPLTPLSPAAKSGRTTPDYFGREARYQSPSRSFSTSRPPPRGEGYTWDPEATQARPYKHPQRMDPLSMNKI